PARQYRLIASTRNGVPPVTCPPTGNALGTTTAAIVSPAASATIAAFLFRLIRATASSRPSTAPYGVTVMSWVRNDPDSSPPTRTTAHAARPVTASQETQRLRNPPADPRPAACSASTVMPNLCRPVRTRDLYGASLRAGGGSAVMPRVA